MEAVSIIQILYRILKAVVESVISGFYTATTLQCYAIPQLSADTSDDGCNQRRHRIKTFIRFCLGILWSQSKAITQDLPLLTPMPPADFHFFKQELFSDLCLIMLTFFLMRETQVLLSSISFQPFHAIKNNYW